MAANPVPITRSGGATPFTAYQIPASGMLELSSIVANWDGSTAAASFWPAVSCYSQDGTLIGRYIPPTAIAPGDSAEVTYGPF